MLRRLSDLITGSGRAPHPGAWQDVMAGASGGADAQAARAERDAARCARAEADRAVRAAEARLRATCASAPALPDGAAWAQRPKAWHAAATDPVRIAPASGTEITPDLTLFHDCPRAEMILRQDLARPGAAAPFALMLDTLRFDGSFLSLVIALPDDGAAALSAREVLRLDLWAVQSAPTRLYGRLNLQQGPNTTQMLAECPAPRDGATRAEFDLAYGGLRDLPVDRAWIDLIVERPAMMRLTLHDLILSRRPRAEI